MCGLSTAQIAVRAGEAEGALQEQAGLREGRRDAAHRAREGRLVAAALSRDDPGRRGEGEFLDDSTKDQARPARRRRVFRSAASAIGRGARMSAHRSPTFSIRSGMFRSVNVPGSTLPRSISSHVHGADTGAPRLRAHGVRRRERRAVAVACRCPRRSARCDRPC